MNVHCQRQFRVSLFLFKLILPCVWAGLLVIAALPTTATAQSITISNLWSISTADGRPYLTNATANSYTERGVAYNVLNNHAYIVSRSGGVVKVAILDGDTGAELGFLNVDGIGGGTFALSTIGVADDGAIYAANLTTGSAASPYKIYRWPSEDAVPTVAYSDNPTSPGGESRRFGESFDVRGGGLDTEIIATALGTNVVAIFKTVDGVNFTSVRLDVSGLIAAADLTKGVGFGPTNTFYGKNNGVTRAVFCSYDLGAGTATVLQNYTLLSGIAPIDADPINNLLAGVESANAASPHNLRVYDLSEGNPVLLYTSAFPAPAANNGNIVGQCQIAGDRIFAIDTQNGVQMAKIFVSTDLTPPSITAQPANVTIVEGGYATLTVGATGSRPFSYQWYFETNAIPGATTNFLNLTNLTLADGGNYSVTVSNVAGTTNSNPAVVTITPSALTLVMTQLWKQAVGSKFYLAADNNSRGIAYNPLNNHLIIVSRTPTNGIHVLDADTGDYLWSLDLTGIAGGTFAINMVACTEEGHVFVGNLTTGNTDPFRLYGYLNDEPPAVPFLAWIGDPGAGDNQRWGDNLDVRIGSTVEAIVASRNGRIVSLLPGINTPLNLPPIVINVPDAENGNFGTSCVFGRGHTFWGKSGGTAIREVAFDLTTGLGTVRRTITNYPNMAVIGYDPANQLLGGISVETPDNVRLLDAGDVSGARLEHDTEFFPTDNPNANLTGAVRMWGNRMFVLESNNGLLALKFGGRLRSEVLGGDLRLSWIGLQTLQATPTVHLPGSWTNVVTSPGPYVAPLSSAPRLFFRLRD